MVDRSRWLPTTTLVVVKPPRILLTLADLPGADGGKRLRAAAILHALSALAHVDAMILLPDELRPFPIAPVAGAARAKMVGVPLRSRPSSLARMIGRRLPWQIAVRDYGPAGRLLTAWCREPYDLVWFGSIDHALSLAEYVTARRVVVDHDDIETTKIQAQLALPHPPGLSSRLNNVQRRVELPMWARIQRLTTERHDAVVVCSELDRIRLDAGRVVVVPNTYRDPGLYERNPPEPPVILVVGTWSYEPNVDAAIFAAREIFPRLRALMPSARLRLIGRDAQFLSSLEGVAGVEIVGRVPDMAGELEPASVALVPVRFGGGTRLKVLEALAWRVPLVCTGVACEGLDVVNGEHALVADDPEGLAEACALLVRNADLRTRLTDAGRTLYLERYLPETADKVVKSLVIPLLRR